MAVGIYFTLMDFGLEASLAVLRAAARAGASLLEVGLPFSDPLLDGPVIQAGHRRALEGGEIPWADICDAVGEVRRTCGAARVSVMTASQLLYDPIRAARLPPVDGILVTDIAWDRPSPVLLTSPRVWFLSQGVVLAAPLPPPPQPISMVYLTRVQGITGADQAAADTTAQAVRRVRSQTPVDVWLGFGASSRADLVAADAAGATGVVIGSAFVSAMERCARDLGDGTPAAVRARVLAEAAGAWVDDLVRA